MTASIVCPTCQAEVPAGFKFCGECGTKLASPVASPQPQASAASSRTGEAPRTAALPPRDEFRDVTVLFADVTGFTSLSEDLDPEQLHGVMNACFDALGRIVQAHGGHIDKYIGDSIMALFGAPTAHEDDPIRAGEAALAMQAFLETFSPPSVPTQRAFRMRIGINCGLVLAGAIGTEGKRDYSVMGDAVNTASRLEGRARPGSILVSDAFKRRVAHHFAFTGPQTLDLKGKDKPITAWELQREASASESAPGQASSRVFVGRARELDVLTGLLASSTHAPSPLWIDLRGPLGVGKSHIAAEALRASAPLRGLHVVCRPTTRLRPFALAKRLLLALAADFSGRATPPATRESFLSALAPVRGDLEPYESALWYLAAPDTLALKAPDPDPLTLRRTLERGLERLLQNVAAHGIGARGDTRSPGSDSRRDATRARVLIIDAIDLADAETLEFLDAIYAKGRALPPVITTARESTPPRSQSCQTLTLPPLSPTEAEELARRAAENAALPDETLHDILARAQGIPLFILELVRSVLEAAPDEAPGAASSQLPSSLLGVMSARLDRLAPGQREALAQCAVQGVDFSADVALRVWSAKGGDAAALALHLRDLEERGFIESQRHAGRRYAFTQALMQNACYDSMLKRDRRALHREVASGLIAHAGGANSVSPEQLATHYELSEQWIAAAEQNLRAGDRAAGLYANSEAISRYERALKALSVEGSPGENLRALAYDAHRGAALVHLRVGRYGEVESEAGAMLTRARDVRQRAEGVRLMAQARLQRGDTGAATQLLHQAERELEPLLAEAASAPQDETTGGAMMVACHLFYDLADLNFRKGGNESASSYIRRCRALVPKACPDALRLDILEGRVAHMQGRFQEAVDLYERAHRTASGLGSLSEEALTSNYMGNAARDVGRYDDAERFFVRALDIWTRVGLTESMAGAHNNLANLAISRGDAATAQMHYGLALQAFEQISNAAGTGLARTNLAILAIEQGRAEDALANAAAAKTLLAASANRVLLGLAAVVKGEASLCAGRIEEAAQEFAWILSTYDAAQHPLAVAGAKRGQGRVALLEGRPQAALPSLAEALALYERLAREQEAGRTELFLARAHETCGDPSAASALLRHALARFEKIGAGSDLARAQDDLHRLARAERS